MRLKGAFVTYKTGANYVAVPESGSESSLGGMVRNNETANFIFKKLATDTTEDAIVEALAAEYNVSFDVARSDVRSVIARWRDEGLILDE